ncbi:PadR family transcriptional regulator [Microbacterium aquilitoris]|uniref:PadR family transcriptional regulator n=1 Tax=Microbacterium aquilitoris TaxID=3067307 RepID=A0ABU3GFK9_9MICO|nr:MULTISPECIES: PadR family transcriptional regulator [unclassified Microbacterium]MDT3329486.1 PadR family transcriptional regulator [Microbacterium sp. KSW-18]MDT3345318.1 PadR family transcriptional regulator [Microbacterium sp. KSW2-22]
MTQEMREPTFLMLTALADSPKHGYALIEEVDRVSRGHVRLKVATLYAALDRLEKEGTIRIAREERVQGRVRRYVELTPDGVDLLAEEVARREVTVAEARRRLALRPAFGGAL